MKTSVQRQAVDLSAYPDMVVIYLGMKIRSLRGIKMLLTIGPQIDQAVKPKPEGLLHYENRIIFSIFPLHIGMRWYWKDFESMEAWTRSDPHRKWWQSFLKNAGGTSFWHETYFMRGGMEAIYDDEFSALGFKAFAPVQIAKGSMFSSRGRIGAQGEVPPPPAGTEETEIY